MSVSIALLVAGGVAVSNLIAAGVGAISARRASNTQADAAQSALNLQTEQFGNIQEILKPYVEAGNAATEQQQALSGAAGPEAQRAAIAQIEGGPQFQSMVDQGENAILANASATGGLRGGNVQGALAQFRPQVLSSLIDQRFDQLGGIAQRGAGAAGGAASAFGAQAGLGTDTLIEQGAARAGGQLAVGEALAGIPGGVMEGVGTFMGLRDNGKKEVVI